MHKARPTLIFAVITAFLDVLGFGLLIPVAPKLVASVQGLATEGREHDVSFTVGAFMATYAVMMFFFSPVLGSLSDHYGRRPVLLIALLGSGLDYFVAAWAPNLWILFITRAINGVSGSTMTVCAAYIADVTPPAKRAGSYAIMGAAFGLGFMVGPLMGGYLGDSTNTIPFIGHGAIHYPYIAAGILTIANFLFGLLVVPESLAMENRRSFSWAKANAMGAVKWLGHHRIVLMLAITTFLSYVSQYGLHATWVLSMQNRFKWTPEDTGWSLFTVGAGAMVVQGFLGRKIIPLLGERVCLVGGLALGVCAFLAYGLATQGWMIYAVIAIASLGGMAGPAAQAICSKAVPPTEQGLLQGALGSMNGIALIVGPLIGSTMFFLFTAKTGETHYPGAGAPFFSSAVLCLLSIVPVLLIWKQLPTSVAKSPGFQPGECPKCGYNRAGLGPDAVCPECGFIPSRS